MKRFLTSLILVSCIMTGASTAVAIPVPDPSLSMLMQDVKSAIRQAQARYDSGNVTGAADLARKILAKYPDNAEAKAILDHCIATEREDYEKAVDSMSVSELIAFQKKYPDSEYGIDVSKRVSDLPLWLGAREKGTIDSYKNYLSESVHQMYKKDADDAISELTVKQAYDAAVAANTIKAFEQFRNQYPGSKYDKDASNKIARLMADKFNSRSTYEDKQKALAFARNEMTRDYVNNKYYKATEKRYSSSSSSSTSTYNSSSSSSNYSSYRPNSQSYGTESKVNFGLQAFFDFGNISQLYPSYSGGLGLEMRIGKVSEAFNFIIGAKIGWASFHYSNSEKQYYGSKSWEYNLVDVNNSGKTTNLFIPVGINWNMLKSDRFCWYLGAGYQYGIPISGNYSPGQQSHAFFIQNGLGFRHFDIRMYYIKYGTSLFTDPVAVNPSFGFSMTYYF